MKSNCENPSKFILIHFSNNSKQWLNKTITYSLLYKYMFKVKKADRQGHWGAVGNCTTPPRYSARKYYA